MVGEKEIRSHRKNYTNNPNIIMLIGHTGYSGTKSPGGNAVLASSIVVGMPPSYTIGGGHTHNSIVPWTDD